MPLKIYLDAAPIIYLVEGKADRSGSAFHHATAEGNIRATSPLSITECLVKPYAVANESLVNRYGIFMSEFINEMIPLTSDVFDQAARLRAQFRLRSPDAIHLAAALQAKCEVFLTNDQRLPKIEGITYEILGFESSVKE